MIRKDFTSLDGVFKLHEGTDPGGLLGRVLKRADMRPHEGRMSCEIVLTKEVEDRSGDLVLVKGIDLSEHRLNPIALFNHNKDYPIGWFRDPQGEYTVKSAGDTLTGELFFNQSSAFAHDVFNAVVDRTFGAASIGFLPVYGSVEKRHPRGTTYGKTKLIEASVLVLGDNPHAVITAVHKALGRPGISKDFRDYLSPLLPSRPAAVVGGYEVTKAMDPNAVDTTQPPQQDPMNPQDAGGETHKDVTDKAMGQILESIWMEYMSGQLDPKKAKAEFAKVVDSHQSHANLGAGGDGEDDEDDDLDSLADDDDVDLSDEDEDDYEDDDDGPPGNKKKHVLVWNEKSVGIGTEAYHFLEADTAAIAAPYQKLLGIVQKALEAGKPVGPKTLAEKIEAADAKASAVIQKGLAITEAMNDGFGPVKKAWRQGLIKKANAGGGKPAALPEDAISDELAERIAAGLADARTELYELTGR